MKAEQIIEKIEELDEVEIMEFDFNECFTYMRELELCMKNIIDWHNRAEVNYEAMRQGEKILAE